MYLPKALMRLQKKDLGTKKSRPIDMRRETNAIPEY